MCGIVGVLNNWKSTGFDGAQQKMVYQLLFADLLRGADATGVIGVEKDAHFTIMKEACDAYNFNDQFIDSKLDKALYKDGVALIGHNRAKTIGENKDENAHPFVVDKTFAMVHNGTLRNHKALADTAVDSEALAIVFKKAMDEEDWKTALEAALGKVEGAFAVVWFDQKRNQVCMMRNKERPLGIVQTNRSVVFGSEIPLLQWIALRNGEKVEKVLSLKEHTLYTFDMTKTGGDYSETFLSPNIPKVVTTSGFKNGTTDVTATSGVKQALGEDSVGPRPLSKNAFKKLRAFLQGKIVPFYIEDAVDMDPNNKGRVEKALVTGYNLKGSYDLDEVRHQVNMVIDFAKCGIKEDELDDACEWQGKVSHCEYDPGNKAIIIHLKDPEICYETIH